MSAQPPSDTPSKNAMLEFGGPVGNAVLTLALPAIVAYLYFCWAFNEGALIPGAEADWAGWAAALVPTWEAAGVYLGWFGLQAAMQAWGPGKIVEGTPLPDGRRLKYKMNGPFAFITSLVLVAALELTGLLPLRFWVDQFGPLIGFITLFSYGFSGFMYWWGKKTDWRPTGSALSDYFMGAGHNPRWPADGLFDFKFFCEARPGLILWVVINAGFASVQYEQYGTISLSMILVNIFQFMYVADYYTNESAVLTTMDIKHENFGFMLVFGDLGWVPMTYTLQAAYLVHNVHELPIWAAVLIVGTNLLGLYIFRQVNIQKHRFRTDPEGCTIWGKPCEYLQTAHGSKLLLSGFWGWSRHFNYVGDLLMALSWSLPCLFDSPLPYYYPIYFAILLIHRERRDHHFCQTKYGADWDAYCEKVPWRIIPGIY